MAAVSRVLIVSIAALYSLTLGAPCHYTGHWPYEEDVECHVHNRQVPVSNTIETTAEISISATASFESPNTKFGSSQAPSTNPVTAITVTETAQWAPAIVTATIRTSDRSVEHNIISPLTTLLVTTVSTFSVSTTTKSVTTYPLNTGSIPTSTSLAKHLMDVLDEKDSQLNRTLAIALSASCVGLLFVLLALYLARRSWKQRKAKKVKIAELREFVCMHGIDANRGAEMLNQSGDDAAASSFETRNRKRLAAQQSERSRVPGSYRGVNPRDRLANSRASLPRLMMPIPTPAQSNNATAATTCVNSSRNSPAVAHVVTSDVSTVEPSRNLTPRGTTSPPVEAHTSSDSAPATSLSSPSGAFCQHQNRLREDLK